MVICSFLGHDRLYDDNVYTKLSKAVRNIARNNDEIEFRFYLHNKFYSMCYDAALEAKQFYTEKKITLKFFVDKDESESFLNRLKHDTLYVPQCIVDQVENLPEFEVKDSKNARMIKFHKTMYWLLKGSTHLISYLYPVFFETENMFYESAKISGVKIIDVTDEETEKFIEKEIDTLHESIAQIIRARCDGISMKAIGEDMGISASTVREHVKNGCRQLKNAAVERKKELAEKNDTKDAFVCSIFAVGPPTHKYGLPFENAFNYISKKREICNFNILGRDCDSFHLKIIGNHVQKNPDMCLTAYTNYPDGELVTEEWWKSVTNAYCPPCHEVKNIDTHTRVIYAQYLRAVKTLIEKSDYCICNLDNFLFADKIRKYAAKKYHVKLLDVGRKYTGQPEEEKLDD